MAESKKEADGFSCLLNAGYCTNVRINIYIIMYVCFFNLCPYGYQVPVLVLSKYIPVINNPGWS